MKKIKPQFIRIGNKRIRMSRIMSYGIDNTRANFMQFQISGLKTLLSKEYESPSAAIYACSVLDKEFEIIDIN